MRPRRLRLSARIPSERQGEKNDSPTAVVADSAVPSPSDIHFRYPRPHVLALGKKKDHIAMALLAGIFRMTSLVSQLNAHTPGPFITSIDTNTSSSPGISRVLGHKKGVEPRHVRKGALQMG